MKSFCKHKRVMHSQPLSILSRFSTREANYARQEYQSHTCMYTYITSYSQIATWIHGYRRRRLRKSRNNNNYVVNLSSKTLSRDTINLLSKGLGYAPVPAPPDRSNLNEDLEALARCLRIAHRFRNNRRQGKKHPFKPKSQWMPPKASNPKPDKYIEKTMAEEPEERTPRPNLSKNEERILQELGKSKDLVIKKADKGSCIVIQDRSAYAAEGKAHLADTSTYKPLDSDPTASIPKGTGEIS